METASCTYTFPLHQLSSQSSKGPTILKIHLFSCKPNFFISSKPHVRLAFMPIAKPGAARATILKHTCFSSLKQMFSSQWVESTESKVHLTRANCCRAATRKRNKNARFSIGRREFQADNALRILLWQLWQAACTLDTLDLQVGWWWGLGCTFTSCLHCSSLSLAKKWSALGNIWQVYQ